MNGKRAQCPMCARSTPVTKDGRLRVHKRTGPDWRMIPCEGSGQRADS